MLRFAPKCLPACGILLLLSAQAAASDPASQDVAIPTTPGQSVVIEWTGTVQAGANPTSDCSTLGVGDHHTINLTVPDGAYDNGLTVQAVFHIDWDSGSGSDLILTVTLDGATVASHDGSTPEEEVPVQNPAAGAYDAIACAFTATVNTPIHGKLTLTAVSPEGASGPPPLPPPPPATSPRYYIFTPPAPLGETSGEPSVGYNLTSHKVMYISGLQTLRATFTQDQSPPMPEACEANWEDVSYVLTSTRSLDPILHTDQRTGRTFVSQLNSDTHSSATGVLIGIDSLFAYTDDDGASWTPGQINAPDGSYDHQSVGAGPYPPPFDALLGNPTNNGSAVYYCSQAGVTALCSRSDDGGLNFGRSVPIYNAVTNGCGGIHGHIRVANDGTVYVPNRGCGATQAITVSEDAGTTWKVRAIPTSTPPTAILDPSIAPASDGTLYFCYINHEGHPHVAVSHDKGQNWDHDTDVGAGFNLQNAVFTEAVAGDPDRAACGFLGTTAAGNHEALDFPGVWYLFIAHTYDGGLTWTTVDATPDDPVQQAGGIWNQGGNVANRNLLDFNEITLDEKGRVIYAFADGCVGGCVPDGPNSYTQKANIVRQSGGKPLLAAFDAEFPQPIAPKDSCLSGRRDDLGAFLKWRAPDNGGSLIKSYGIYRSDSAAGPFSQVGTAGSKAAFSDRSVVPTVDKYYYKITAVNDQGTGPYSNVIELPLGPRPTDASVCVVPGVQVIADATGDSTIPNDAFDITSVSLAEPTGDLDGKLVFTLKVVSLQTVPNGWRWAVRFSPPTIPAGQEDYFVSMVTSDGAAPAFTYGNTGTTVAGQDAGTRIFTTLGNLDPASAFNADGTITLVLDKSKIGSPQPGDDLINILGSVRATTPSALPGSGGTNETIPDSTSGGSYRLRTADFCLPNTPPLARLVASVSSGGAPLTVLFDGSSSSDAEDQIAKYTFNFGDGTGDFEQAAPQISHTYPLPGLYAAKLVVTDSRGLASQNVAQAVIQVGAATAGAAGRDTTRFGGALGLALLLPMLGLGLRRNRSRRTRT